MTDTPEIGPIVQKYRKQRELTLGQADGEKHYYAFFSECPIKECVSWNPAAIGGLQGNDQVKTS